MGTRISPHPIFPDGNVQSDLGKMAQGDIFRSIREIPILNGVLLEDVQLKGATVTHVPHTLGRRYKGYIVVSNNLTTTIIVDDDGNPDKTKYIGLKSANTLVVLNSIVSLWVF